MTLRTAAGVRAAAAYGLASVRQRRRDLALLKSLGLLVMAWVMMGA